MINKHATIDYILLAYCDDLGSDHDRYRNHVYRMYNFALQLGGEELNEHDREVLAIAAGFHDLAIWTHKTFDYLQPSAELAVQFLKDKGKDKMEEEVSLLISEHHKISAYHGPFEKTVELFRKADWIDVSLSTLTFGLSSKQLKDINNTFPYDGFHTFLVRQSLKNFVKHPFNPLPMFKR